MGIIAKSGTKELLVKVKEKHNLLDNLIGNFGIGFYSVFMVADNVVLESRRVTCSENNAVRWISSGKETFSIENIRKVAYGTKIILHMSENGKIFLNSEKIESIVKKYSNHIIYPIILNGNKVLNDKFPIWKKKKESITYDEYENFYKNLTNDNISPISFLHLNIEGNIEYTALFYIPSKFSFDMYLNKNIGGLKLYVKNVFVLDVLDKFLPNYLRFIKGIIDIDNLNLNISRDILQETKLIENIKTSITKKILKFL